MNISTGADDSDHSVDSEDDMLELPGEAGRTTSALSLLLLLIGMIFIPLGLILVFLALARGDNARQATIRVGVPDVAPGIDRLAGRWLIIGGPESSVAYKAGGQTSGATLPVNEVKTEKVDGGIVIFARTDGTGSVTGIALNADLTELKSSNPAFDQALKTTGLETNKFPYAEFVVPDTDPISIPRVPPFGEHLDLKAKGQLKLHGVTKDVEARLTASLIQADPVLIELTGTVPLNFADFDVSPAVSGEVSFHLRLARVPDEVSTRTPHGSSTAVQTNHP